jgi:hypothetical protein
MEETKRVSGRGTRGCYQRKKRREKGGGSTATFTSSSLISNGNELFLSGEGEPESSASSWAVRGSSEGANGRERSGGEGVRPFIWARNARGVCGGDGVF